MEALRAEGRDKGHFPENFSGATFTTPALASDTGIMNVSKIRGFLSFSISWGSNTQELLLLGVPKTRPQIRIRFQIPLPLGKGLALPVAGFNGGVN